MHFCCIFSYFQLNIFYFRKTKKIIHSKNVKTGVYQRQKVSLQSIYLEVFHLLFDVDNTAAL
jgi:hypothetical protein